MVTLERITKKFQVQDADSTETCQIRGGFFYALDDISITIENGCSIIAGANGSGKSLLMSIIAGLQTPSSGVVKTAERVGLVFQEPDAQILGETPREDIAFGPRNLGLPKDVINARVKTALEKTGLTERADFPARSLSGGEKRRLAASGVLAMDARIIIFDEPYANMDYPGVVSINSLFQELTADGKTLIILTHELEKCLALADRFIVLCKGKIVFDGKTDDALSLDLEAWGIHHPFKNLSSELKKEDLIWR